MKWIDRIVPGALLACAALWPAAAGAKQPARETFTLAEYLTQVAEYNLDYAVQKFNVRIAEAEAVAAGVFPDPELAFEGMEEGYLIELGYTLELGGKRRARLRLARSEAEAERLAAEYFFNELRAEATEAFLEALLQQELLRFRQSSYEYMHRLSQSDSIRFALGEITENDARQSRIETSALLNEVYRQEGVWRAALVELERFMGRAGDGLAIPQGSLSITPADYDLKQLTEMALDNRADLLEALQRSEVALNQLKLVRAERRIDIDLLVGYERDWQGFLPNRSTVKGGVAIPLRFSNINKGAVQAANHEIGRAAAEYAGVEVQVQTEVAQAYFLYEATRRQIEQFRTDILDDTQRLLDGVVYKYTRGETDILEVLIAQRTYNELQEQYLETLRELASAHVELQRSCGVWVPVI